MRGPSYASPEGRGVSRNFRFPTSDKDANSPTPPLAQAVGAFPWSWLKLVHESGQFHRFVRAGSLLRTVCGPFPTTPLHAPVSSQPIWKPPSRAAILPVPPASRSSAACLRRAGASDDSPPAATEIVTESRIAQIIDRARKAAEQKSRVSQGHLFADLEKRLRESDRSKRIEFYTHEEGWKNKLISGDSLLVMESLLHYEALRGKVQMIYVDPPYGIKYDSNFQQQIDSTRNDEKDQADDVLTIKAFRDTWGLGIHSYLSYPSERLYLCRELLADSGSVFVQINDENVHLVRILLDECFGKKTLS